MYNHYFGFSESPFNIIPNSRFYYHTQSCREVLEVVQNGVEMRKGLIVVVGEPGSGKTLFLKFLERVLAPEGATVVVQNPRADLDIILRLLMERLELHGAVDDRTARLGRLTEYLISERKAGRLVCLLIDEAQDLEARTLDELRLLANLEFDGDALLPIVLVGQLELNLKLDQPCARRIKQRVALTRNIYPLIRKELEPYIDTRLKIAGYEHSGLFSHEAIDAIAAHSGGIPRVVNSICDNSLFKAYTMEQRVISAATVDQVARELRISAPMSLQKGFGRAADEAATTNGSEGVEFCDLKTAQANARHESFAFAGPENADIASEAAKTIKPPAAKIVPQRDPDELQKSHPMPRLRGPNWGPQKLFSARTGWYALAATIAVSLLALNVNSSQLADIYSKLSGKHREPAAGSPARGRQDEQSRETAGSDRPRTQPDPWNLAAAKPQGESQAPGSSGGTSTQPAQPISPLPLAPSDGSFQRPQSPEDLAAKKSEAKPAVVTLEVVKRSTVRAKPNNESAIIAELEPGDRVTVLAKSRDYYHVRSVEDKSVRGYVHREDAFFEGRYFR